MQTACLNDEFFSRILSICTDIKLQVQEASLGDEVHTEEWKIANAAKRNQSLEVKLN